jgi:3-dehydroquinate synthase
LHHVAGTTPVWVGEGALEKSRPELASALVDRRVFAITSAKVYGLHGAALERLAAGAADFQLLEVADGEVAKTVETAAGIWRRLLLNGGKRDSLVIAFGGGSVGDLAGFVAGCFLRGIDVLQVPTTLLAQVDAAIGGKTAVNLPEAKNSVGVFHHPVGTVADTRLLSTLAPRQLRSGLFEVLKTGAVLDSGLFDLLEADLDAALSGDALALAPIVERTAAAKIRLVENDPQERDRRRLLNFGHTLGHALELATDTLEHGEAVGYGMLFALDLAIERGLPVEEAERARTLIRRLGLPPLAADIRLEGVLRRVERDKKAREDGIAWVLPLTLGSGEIFTDVPLEDVARRIAGFLETAC